VGARLLSQIRCADEGENGRRGMLGEMKTLSPPARSHVLGIEKYARLTGVAPRGLACAGWRTM